MFTANTIKERIQETPFVPARIITSAGDRYDVHHPDLVWVGKHYLLVGTASEDNPTIWERYSRLSVLHIVAIEDLPVKTGATQNGTAP